MRASMAPGSDPGAGAEELPGGEDDGGAWEVPVDPPQAPASRATVANAPATSRERGRRRGRPADDDGSG